MKRRDSLRIVSLGDSALIVHVADEFESDPPAALEAVLHVSDQIRAAKIDAVTDVAPAYTSVAVFFDPVRVRNFEEIVDAIRNALAKSSRSSSHRGRTIEIPVCYDGDFAPDLRDVAESAGISTDDVVRLHSRAKYLVSCVGFAPGFPYLSGLPRALATPRRATPRTRVPAGAVAIGGAQTGIYPQESPGGWNIIGRTPMRLFDATQNPPALLRAGDKVRFRRISRDAFESHAL